MLSILEVGGWPVVALSGDVDIDSAPALRDAITQLIATGSYHLIIDLEQVEFLDSCGLGVLVGGLKKTGAHDGSLQLVCNQDRLLRLFEITGLNNVLAIHRSTEDALAALEQ